MDPGTRQLLAGQRVVYLETGFAAAVHRTGLDAPRPLLIGNPRTRMRELLAERLPVYEGLAWVTVATDDRAPQEIADEIAAAITARIAAETGEGAGTSPGWPPPHPPGAAADWRPGGPAEGRAVRRKAGRPAEGPGGPAGQP